MEINNINIGGLIALSPLIILVVCTIIALIYNYKGKAAIFVNGWDMLLFILSAVAFAIGQESDIENGHIWMIAGAAGVVLSFAWTIYFSYQCGFNFFLVICCLLAKILFFFLLIILFVLTIFKSICNGKDHEYTETTTYSDGSSFTRTIYVPKSDIELEYLNDKWANSVAPFVTIFFSRVRKKR